MAQYTNIPLQNVATGQNVLFANTAICSNSCNIIHREGSGIVTLRGGNGKCARYKISFNGNIAVPTGGTATDPVSFAISVSGEALGETIMTETPGVVAQFNNVSATTFVTIPCNCCETISVENVGTQAVDIQNANLVIERVC